MPQPPAPASVKQPAPPAPDLTSTSFEDAFLNQRLLRKMYNDLRDKYNELIKELP